MISSICPSNTSQVTLYLNGTEIAQQVLNEVIGDATGLPWVVGQEWDGMNTSDFFEGQIEEIIFWSTALSQSQIREQMHTVRDGLETDLLAYWQFNEGSGTLPIEALTSNTGSLVGNSIYVDSEFPVGPGTSDRRTVNSNGSYVFSTTNSQLDFNGVSGSFETVVTRIDADPGGDQPEEAASYVELVKNPYFIVETFDAGTFTAADLTLVLGNGAFSESDPSEVRLLRRGSNDIGNWTEETTASTATPATGTLIFNGLSAFSQFTVGTSPGPLPVELLDFTARWQPILRTVRLEWKTAFEVNNDRFELERSQDGERWVPLSVIRGSGNTGRIRNYRYEDDQIISSGLYYYRLKQVDFDGQYEYSPIRLVVVPGMTNFKVYPNPLTEQSVLKIHSEEEQEFILRLIHKNGKLLFSKKISVPKGISIIPVSDLNYYPNNDYILRIESSSQQESLRIIR
jgi:hypothetical protein